MDDRDRDRHDIAGAATVAAPDTPTRAGSETATLADPQADVKPASALSRYRIDSVLGRGGMGEVVSAHDDQIGRSVAIKRMRGTAPSPDAVARFLREARIQGRLEHPAVVPVHELWRDDDGNPFFVMKQLTGTTLEQVLAKLAANEPEATKQFTRQRLLRAFVDVCLAIEFAHTRGVIHRDLKPANITLGDFGEVYVLDWGIARVVGEERERASFADIDSLDGNATMAGSVLGTPGYMAPEQVRGDTDLDGRTDVYALGCILFELLAGLPLHPRGQPALASTLVGAADARPSARAPEREIAPELDAACLAAVMLDRTDRIATARALGDLVQRFLDGDRDVALRRELASVELDTARAALAHGNTAADRRTAIRAAARALALDPQAREPAELVGRLMIEPPDEIPREVEDEMLALEAAALREQARLSRLAMLSYLAFFPILYAAGYRDAWYFVAGTAIVGTLIGLSYAAQRRPTNAIAGATFVINLGLIALFARITSPFLVAPGLAAVSLIVYASHPGLLGIPVLAACSIAAVLVPWFAELAGLVSSTTTITDGNIVLHASAETLDPTITFAAMVLYVIAIVTIAGLLPRLLANNRLAMQRTVQIQSWQLRQLVPRAATASE